MLFFLPAVLLGALSAMVDPEHLGIHTGDPRYSTLEWFSGLLLLVGFSYIPLLLVARVLLWIARRP